MNQMPEPAISEPVRWTRAAVMIVRVVLLVFLLWALISTNFPGETPVAEDGAAPPQDSRTAVDPCPDRFAALG